MERISAYDYLNLLSFSIFVGHILLDSLHKNRALDKHIYSKIRMCIPRNTTFFLLCMSLHYSVTDSSPSVEVLDCFLAFFIFVFISTIINYTKSMKQFSHNDVNLNDVLYWFFSLLYIH